MTSLSRYAIAFAIAGAASASSRTASAEEPPASGAVVDPRGPSLGVPMELALVTAGPRGAAIRQVLNVGFTLFAPRTDWCSMQLSAGGGLYDVYARVGVSFAPWGRSRLGPEILLGVRGTGGLFMDLPSDERLPQDESGGGSEAYGALFGELALGLHVPIGTRQQVVVAPTFLAGPAWYQASATASGVDRRTSGSAMFFGGTLVATIAW